MASGTLPLRAVSSIITGTISTATAARAAAAPSAPWLCTAHQVSGRMMASSSQLCAADKWVLPLTHSGTSSTSTRAENPPNKASQRISGTASRHLGPSTTATSSGATSIRQTLTKRHIAATAEKLDMTAAINSSFWWEIFVSTGNIARRIGITSSLLGMVANSLATW